jgi:hypothetical protein
MLSNGVRYVLVVLLYGVVGAAIWAYTSQHELQRRQVSLRSMFWLILAVAVGINFGLWFIGFFEEFRVTMD